MPAASSRGADGAMPETDSTTEDTTGSSTTEGEAPATGAETDDEAGALAEAGKRALAAERKTAKDAKTALKAAQDELAQLRNAGLSEADKVTKELNELRDKVAGHERDAQARTATETLTAAAVKAGASDAAARQVARLYASDYDASADNSAELVRAAKADLPDLFGTRPGVTPANGRGGTAPVSANDWLRSQL